MGGGGVGWRGELYAFLITETNVAFIGQIRVSSEGEIHQ